MSVSMMVVASNVHKMAYREFIYSLFEDTGSNCHT